MDSKADAQLATLTTEQTRTTLKAMGLEWTPSDLSTAAAVRFKRQAQPAPLIVGLLGGASSGKSTLFNSLLGHQASRISAHAHETVGPIAAVHRDTTQHIVDCIRNRLLFSGFDAAVTNGKAPTSGEIKTVNICSHDHSASANVMVVDLPDITSKIAADEGALTWNLLPWFDGLLIVVDEERWFDAAVFDETIAFAGNLGPALWVVFNRTERSDELTPEQRQVLRDHAASRHALDHCISPFQPGAGYRPVSEKTRARIHGWFDSLDDTHRVAELEGHLRRRCSAVLRELMIRNEQLRELRKRIDRETDQLTQEARLSTDLLTPDERALLNPGRRFVPLYDVVQSVRGQINRFRRRRRSPGEIDFDKGVDALADVLRRNLEHRFRHATDTLDRIILDSPYLAGTGLDWRPQWEAPALDARQWAVRIRAHIDAWKAETTQQSRRSDAAALALGTPLLLADLLFLGGAGITMTWATVWIAGFFGGKGLVRMFDRSPAFKDYQTTVAAYHAIVRETLSRQCAANLDALPRRHVPMNDPIVEAMVSWSAPQDR